MVVTVGITHKACSTRPRGCWRKIAITLIDYREGVAFPSYSDQSCALARQFPHNLCAVHTEMPKPLASVLNGVLRRIRCSFSSLISFRDNIRSGGRPNLC